MQYRRSVLLNWPNGGCYDPKKIPALPGRGKGGHLLVHRLDPPTEITIANQSEVKRGTLRGILRQAGLSVEEILSLL